MPSASVTAVIATIVFWALMLVIGGYTFQTVCNLCGADPPSFRRSMLTTALVGAAAFFTFDGLGYGIVLASRDTVNLNLPPGYGYGNWLREPLYLKWQVMGLVPLLRWLPVLFAGCLAATLYVFILAEPFRNCIAILAIQWTLNVVAMAILSFALSQCSAFRGASAIALHTGGGARLQFRPAAVGDEGGDAPKTSSRRTETSKRSRKDEPQCGGRLQSQRRFVHSQGRGRVICEPNTRAIACHRRTLGALS